MKKANLLFFYFLCLPILAEENLSKKTLSRLNKNQASSKLFTELLLKNPESKKVRYNLALSFYREGEMAKASAYWRQILFQNAYNTRSRKALQAMGQGSPWWLFVPSDAMLACLAFAWALMIFFLYKKRFFHLKIYLFPLVFVQALASYYFFHRLGSYATLIKDGEVLSAPDKLASSLFMAKSGTLLKVARKSSNQWSYIEEQNNRKGWLPSSLLISLKIKDNAR